MAADIRAEVRKGVDEWMAAGNRRPQLTAVIVGEDPASQTYVKNKMKAADDTGMFSVDFFCRRFHLCGCIHERE